MRCGSLECVAQQLFGEEGIALTAFHDLRKGVCRQTRSVAKCERDDLSELDARQRPEIDPIRCGITVKAGQKRRQRSVVCRRLRAVGDDQQNAHCR